MCREGGCGACLVTAKVIDPNSGSEVTKSVNSVCFEKSVSHYPINVNLRVLMKNVLISV